MRYDPTCIEDVEIYIWFIEYIFNYQSYCFFEPTQVYSTTNINIYIYQKYLSVAKKAPKVSYAFDNYQTANCVKRVVL